MHPFADYSDNSKRIALHFERSCVMETEHTAPPRGAYIRSGFLQAHYRLVRSYYAPAVIECTTDVARPTCIPVQAMSAILVRLRGASRIILTSSSWLCRTKAEGRGCCSKFMVMRGFLSHIALRKQQPRPNAPVRGYSPRPSQRRQLPYGSSAMRRASPVRSRIWRPVFARSTTYM